MKSTISTEEYLVRRMFEFSQYPESLAADAPGKKILDIVPHFVIGHRAFNNIVSMRFSMTACGHEVEPFISHFCKRLYFEGSVWNVLIDTDDMWASFGNCPPLCLTFYAGAVETEPKVFIVAYNANFRGLYYGISSMIDDNWCIFCHNTLLYLTLVR